jgi:hypothetical protein
MTCHAIYWQKARTKSKDIDSSDRLTAVCVCQRVKGNIAARFRCTCHTLVSDETWRRLFVFYDSSHKTLLLAGKKANLKLAPSYFIYFYSFIHLVSAGRVWFVIRKLKGTKHTDSFPS